YQPRPHELRRPWSKQWRNGASIGAIVSEDTNSISSCSKRRNAMAGQHSCLRCSVRLAGQVMITLRQFSEKTTKDLRRLVERDRQEKTFTTGALEDESSSGVCGERFARTTTRTENPVYPSTPATKFVVEFGEYKFDNTTTGNELAVFTAYTPKTTRIAYSRFGWLPQNTLVRMNLHHGRWFIKSDYTLVRHLAKTTSLIASKGSGP